MARLARSLFLALAAGAAGGAAATLLRGDGGGAKPTAKSAVRAGLLLFERMRGAFGEMSETMSDMVAEAQHEIEEERRRAEDGDEHVVPFEAKAAAAEGERKAHG